MTKDCFEQRCLLAAGHKPEKKSSKKGECQYKYSDIKNTGKGLGPELKRNAGAQGAACLVLS